MHWLTKDMRYFRKLMNVDGRGMPIVSPRIIKSMVETLNDAQSNAKKFDLSFQMIVGGKDKIVDNAGAR